MRSMNSPCARAPLDVLNSRFLLGTSTSFKIEIVMNGASPHVCIAEGTVARATVLQVATGSAVRPATSESD